MSDLIRRKDVLEYLGRRIQLLDQPGDYMLRIECEIIRDYVEDDVPAVDAVPVVRCRDCINGLPDDHEALRYCHKFRRKVCARSYCSCGITAAECEEADETD